MKKISVSLSGHQTSISMESEFIECLHDIAKAEHYKLIQELAEEFKSKCGTIICREILGLDEGSDSYIPSVRTEQYYEERPCENCIKIASEIIERRFLN